MIAFGERIPKRYNTWVLTSYFADLEPLMMGSTEIPECLDSLDFLDCPGLPLILVWFTWTDQWGLVTSLSACHTVRPWSQRSGYVTWHLVSTNLRWPPAIISHSVWYINSWGVSMKCRNFFSIYSYLQTSWTPFIPLNTLENAQLQWSE